MKTALAILVCGAVAVLGQAQDAHPGHDHHSGTVESRGDMEMGFPHEKTTHHFYLYPDGGAIEVSANDPNDTKDVAAIRMHLRHISQMFTAGNFSAPMFIHDQVPPGVPVLKKAASAVSYRFEEIQSGARVRIQTTDKDALNGVHEFLRFQIADHRTGDPTTISSASQ